MDYTSFAAIHHPRLRDALILLSGAAITSMLASFLRRRKSPPKTSHFKNIEHHFLESKLAIERLLATQYGNPKDVLIPAALDDPFIVQCWQYPSKISILVERNCPALQDFSGEHQQPIALDIGCTVGRTTFELVRCGFSQVYGIDTSPACIQTASAIRDKSWIRFSLLEEGELLSEHTASLPDDIDADRATFMIIDEFTQISKSLSKQHAFDAVLVSNLLHTRIKHPKAFLRQLSELVKQRGIVVISSDFMWKESSITEKKDWLGGYRDDNGNDINALEVLSAELQPHFQLIAREDLPCYTVESKKKASISLSTATVWRRM